MAVRSAIILCRLLWLVHMWPCAYFLPTRVEDCVFPLHQGFFPTFFYRFYLFIFRKRWSEGKRGRETSMCGCLSCGPHWGTGLQPRHVPWQGIELVTLWFTAHTQSTELHQSGLGQGFLRGSASACLLFSPMSRFRCHVSALACVDQLVGPRPAKWKMPCLAH